MNRNPRGFFGQPTLLQAQRRPQSYPASGRPSTAPVAPVPAPQTQTRQSKKHKPYDFGDRISVPAIVVEEGGRLEVRRADGKPLTYI
ncbi:MAG: hypothetical protein P4L81_03115 [Candidatus Pacebacteria bacterium]|nr:hypothetical protein [Candidatus Paceibacterota bacterium]